MYFGPLMDFQRCCCWQSTYIATLLLSSQFLRRNRRWRVDQTPIPRASTAVGTFSIPRTSLRTSKSMSSKMFTFLLFSLFATPSVKSRSSFCSPLLSLRLSCHALSCSAEALRHTELIWISDLCGQTLSAESWLGLSDSECWNSRQYKWTLSRKPLRNKPTRAPSLFLSIPISLSIHICLDNQSVALFSSVRKWKLLNPRWYTYKH